MKNAVRAEAVRGRHSSHTFRLHKTRRATNRARDEQGARRAERGGRRLPQGARTRATTQWRMEDRPGWTWGYRCCGLSGMCIVEDGIRVLAYRLFTARKRQAFCAWKPLRLITRHAQLVEWPPAVPRSSDGRRRAQDTRGRRRRSACEHRRIGLAVGKSGDSRIKDGAGRALAGVGLPWTPTRTHSHGTRSGGDGPAGESGVPDGRYRRYVSVYGACSAETWLRAYQKRSRRAGRH